MNKKKAGILMCTHFNCDHRRGNYCCFQCQKIGTCKNPCYNSPLKCGWRLALSTDCTLVG